MTADYTVEVSIPLRGPVGPEGPAVAPQIKINRQGSEIFFGMDLLPALTALQEGDIVFVPPGTFELGNNAEFVLPDDAAIIGAGERLTKIVSTAGGPNIVALFYTGKNNTVSNLSIEMPRNLFNAAFWISTTSENLLLENCVLVAGSDTLYFNILTTATITQDDLDALVGKVACVANNCTLVSSYDTVALFRHSGKCSFTNCHLLADPSKFNIYPPARGAALFNGGGGVGFVTTWDVTMRDCSLVALSAETTDSGNADAVNFGGTQHMLRFLNCEFEGTRHLSLSTTPAKIDGGIYDLQKVTVRVGINSAVPITDTTTENNAQVVFTNLESIKWRLGL